MIPFFFHATKRVPVARALCIPNATTYSPLRNPFPLAILYTTIHHHHHVLSLSLSPSISLSRCYFFYFSTFSAPPPALYPTYEYVYYVAPRPPDARKKFGPACGRARNRHVLSPWINVSRASFDLDSIRTLLGLFASVTCLATRFS